MPYKLATERRILNEFTSKILNEEKLDKVVAHRKANTSPHSDMSFQCECDDETCDQSIRLSTAEYQQVHRKANHFIVIPGHVCSDIEKVITSFANYVLVEKFFPNEAS